MPRPPHLCTCGRTVPHGTRCQCQIDSTRARNARHDARRPSARERGYTGAWDKARATYLAHHPSCKCGRPATLVDHIIPHRGDQALFWDSAANWQALCTSCHSRHKQRLERGQ